MDPKLETDPVNVLLDRLQQECARVILTCSSIKRLRLGAGTISHGVTNLELLAKEMSDVNHVWSEMKTRLGEDTMDLRNFPLQSESVDGLLDRLQEECAEAIQACSKIKRFGAETVWRGEMNWKLLAHEMNDVTAVWNEVARRLTNNRIGHRE